MNNITEFLLDNSNLKYVTTDAPVNTQEYYNIISLDIIDYHLFLQYEIKKDGVVMALKTIDLGRVTGITFTPNISSDGVLSWTNDGDVTNPNSVNIKGAKGDTGSKGDTGEKGADGKSISSIISYYLVNNLTSEVTTATTGWTTTIQQTTTENKYLWSYEKITFSDDTTILMTPRIIGTHGENGYTPVLSTNEDGHLIATYTQDVSEL